MSHVKLMVASGSKCSRIYDYIRDNSPHRVQMRDVYNLIAKIKKAGSNLTDEDQVAELLVDFNVSADAPQRRRLRDASKHARDAWNINYVEEMSQLLGMTSEWLAGMFETEYKFATTCDAITNYTIDDQELHVILRRNGRAHRSTRTALPSISPTKTPAPDKGVRVPPLTLSLLARTDKPLDVPADRSDNAQYLRYHSLAKLAYHNLLEEIEGDLVKRSLPQPYQIVSVHCPIQKDGDNCGLFICLFYWRRVFKEAGNDYSESGLLRRHWDLLRILVDFSDSNKSVGEETA
ncbi:hypothetical protein GQ600_13935 [Phytophthora cactorum]|nr:hypothetical protein GQ600_13935 [Phytophthora cactorum]